MLQNFPSSNEVNPESVTLLTDLAEGHTHEVPPLAGVNGNFTTVPHQIPPKY